MKKLLALALSLLTVLSLAVARQKLNPGKRSNSASATIKKRGPIFRATKEQIKQAQTILKTVASIAGTPPANLTTRRVKVCVSINAPKDLKVTGTLNKITLEKMGIELTDKQKAM